MTKLRYLMIIHYNTVNKSWNLKKNSTVWEFHFMTPRWIKASFHGHRASIMSWKKMYQLKLLQELQKRWEKAFQVRTETREENVRKITQEFHGRKFIQHNTATIWKLNLLKILNQYGACLFSGEKNSIWESKYIYFSSGKDWWILIRILISWEREWTLSYSCNCQRTASSR
jgi:hypothetical protein